MPLRPKQLSRLGEFHLEEAILDVLLEAKHENECVGAAEISKRAGIHRESGEIGMNDAIVSGMLNKLFDMKKVQRCALPSRGKGWELTDTQFKKRRDDF